MKINYCLFPASLETARATEPDDSRRELIAVSGEQNSDVRARVHDSTCVYDRVRLMFTTV